MEILRMIVAVASTVCVVCFAIFMVGALVSIGYELIVDWRYERRRKK